MATLTFITTSPPANTVAPSISGTLTVGQVISCSTGSWSNSPNAYAYQWKRATTSGGTYSDISGATASTYTLQAGDETYYIKCQVTASNAGGAGTPALTSASGPVAAASSSLLTASDLAYLGHYDLQVYGSDNCCGLTTRYSSGVTYLAILQPDAGDGLNLNDVAEFSLAGKSFGDTLTTPDFTFDISSLLTYRGIGGASWQGLHWDETSSSYYICSNLDYDATDHAEIIFFTRSGSSITASRGPFWLEGVPGPRYNGGFMAIPAGIQSAYGVERLGVGLGGYSSNFFSHGATIGPALFTIPHLSSYTDNSQVPATDFSTLLSKTTSDSLSLRGHRPWDSGTFTPTSTRVINGQTVATGSFTGNRMYDYFLSNDQRGNGNQGPAPDFLPMGTEGTDWGELPSYSGRTAWTWKDRSIGGFMLYGSKRGVVFISSNGRKRVWYGNSAVTREEGECCVSIYDPDDLGAVAQGSITSDSVVPESVFSLPDVGAMDVGSAAYEPNTSRLYIRTAASSGYSRIHVYSVATS